MIYTLFELRHWSVTRQTAHGWVPARPIDGPAILRWRAAWAVLRGRADAFVWPEQAWWRCGDPKCEACADLKRMASR